MKRCVIILLMMIFLCTSISCAAEDTASPMQTALEKAASGANLLPDYQWSESGYYYGRHGRVYNGDTNYRAIELVPVNAGQSYRLVNHQAKPWVSGQVWWYDKDKEAISECAEAEAAMHIEGETDFTAPEGACYIGLSFASKGDASYLNSLTEFRQTTGLTVTAAPTLSGNGVQHDNRVIVTLGDSIFGLVDGEDGIANLLAQRLGCTVINCAFGGTRAVQRSEDDGYNDFDFSALVNAIVSRDYSVQEAAAAEHERSMLASRLETLKTVDFDHVDVVTLNYGTNDWTGWFIMDAYMDGYAEAISKLMAAYPHLQVVLITPAYRMFYNDDGTFKEDGDTRTGHDGSTLADVAEGAKQVAQRLHIPCIDAYSFGINRYNYSYYFSGKDGVHHNANGRALMAEKIAQELR